MTTIAQTPVVLKHLLALLAGYRRAFGQERVYRRIVGLVLAEVLAWSGHRVTDLLRALGLVRADWSAWYRVWQRPQRFAEEGVARCLFDQVLAQVAGDEVLAVGVDGLGVPRDSQTMEGSGWLKCPRNPPWRVSIHRGQRFLNGSWLIPIVNGFSRAIPLRCLPAFPEKAVHQAHASLKEYLAGSAFVQWVRRRLDSAGRPRQWLLCLGDANFDKPEFWSGLPSRTVALVRTAKNRALCQLPGPYAGRGRRRLYGAAAPAPQAYLRRRDGWKRAHLTVPGRRQRVVFRLEGSCLRRGMAAVPVFLIVVRGQQFQRGRTSKRREPCFYLVNAVRLDDRWQLPLPIETLLSWAWQRWELEGAHRELKSVLGLGDKQCFHPLAAVASVQWSAWVYALLSLAAFRAYGLGRPHPRATAWQRHPRRWTLSTVLDETRLQLAATPLFSGLFSPSPRNWPEIEAILLSLPLHAHPSTSLHPP